MSDKITYFTKEGLENLRNELNNLKTKERRSIATQIQEAREKGDLSENAEYKAAKEAQSLLETKIIKLENALSTARILDESIIDASKVSVHSRVRIKNVANGKEMTYKLVAEEEANVREGKISVESPVGKGLLGKSKGDRTNIQVPSGIVEFEIIEISR